MIQTVYVLEILRANGVVRGHFAQTRGAAQRAAAGKYHLSGRWEDVNEPSSDELQTSARRVVARLLGPGGEELARVLREALEYG